MSRYSIKELEKLSGIKAHTIRIWEKRYGLLVPERTDSNIRYYDDEQLKRLLNVSLLINSGWKVSKVAKLDPPEIKEALREAVDQSADIDLATENKINGLVVSMMELDEDKFNAIFHRSVLRRGFLKTVIEVLYPFLNKVGILWSYSEINPAQEHFISYLIREKIIVATEGLGTVLAPKANWVLFLPENELHEIGLLISNYLLRSHNIKTIYLGANVPMNDIKGIHRICTPDAYLSFIVTPLDTPLLEAYLRELFVQIANSTLYLAGASHYKETLEKFEHVVHLTSIQEILDILKSKE